MVWTHALMKEPKEPMTKQERQDKILETVRRNGVSVVSTRSLADAFAVSEITIRRDLQALAGEGLIQRRHGGVSAPQVPSSRVRHVGILLASRHGKFSHPFYNEVLEGADAALQRLGYHPAFVRTFIEVDSLRAVQDLTEAYPVEGLLMIGELNRERFERWREHVPYIVTAPVQLSATSDGVLFDGYNGVRELMDHLLTLGHKRFGFIASKSMSGQIDSRREGFLASVAEHGLDSDPELVFEMPHSLELFPYKISQAGAEKLMALKTPPDVIVCSSDMIALGTLKSDMIALGTLRLQNQGVRVPEEVAVTGFDNLAEASRAFPPLTTVQVHKKLMGSIAAELLHRRIENPGDPALKVVTPTSLVVRKSCGTD